MNKLSTFRAFPIQAKVKELPIGGLMDPRFVYVPSEKTDIRKTFERIRAQQSKEAK